MKKVVSKSVVNLFLEKLSKDENYKRRSTGWPFVRGNLEVGKRYNLIHVCDDENASLISGVVVYVPNDSGEYLCVKEGIFNGGDAPNKCLQWSCYNGDPGLVDYEYACKCFGEADIIKDEVDNA